MKLGESNDFIFMHAITELAKNEEILFVGLCVFLSRFVMVSCSPFFIFRLYHRAIMFEKKGLQTAVSAMSNEVLTKSQLTESSKLF